jgi:hypothetical protein
MRHLFLHLNIWRANRFKSPQRLQYGSFWIEKWFLMLNFRHFYMCNGCWNMNCTRLYAVSLYTDRYEIFVKLRLGLPPGGSSTEHIYTQTLHRMTHNKQYTEQHKNFGRALAMPRLCELYPGICLTAEEKARKNPISSRRSICLHSNTTDFVRTTFGWDVNRNQRLCNNIPLH